MPVKQYQKSFVTQCGSSYTAQNTKNLHETNRGEKIAKRKKTIDRGGVSTTAKDSLQTGSKITIFHPAHSNVMQSSFCSVLSAA